MTAYVEVQTNEVGQVMEVARREFKQRKAAHTVKIFGTPAIHAADAETFAVCTLAWCGAIARRKV